VFSHNHGIDPSCKESQVIRSGEFGLEGECLFEKIHITELFPHAVEIPCVSKSKPEDLVLPTDNFGFVSSKEIYIFSGESYHPGPDYKLFVVGKTPHVITPPSCDMILINHAHFDDSNTHSYDGLFASKVGDVYVSQTGLTFLPKNIVDWTPLACV